ncbi:MAG: NADH-quinone oxidoreductase subunit J [Phycisphaerae bacterium]
MSNYPWLEPLMFYLFAGVTLGAALGIVLTGNIVRAALYLLGALGGVGGLYFLLMANLLAAVQLIVYAGGTLVLIIFGVMLTSRTPWARFKPSRGEAALGAVVALGLFTALARVLTGVNWSAGAQAMESPATVRLVGNLLLQEYLVPFEAASVLLLVVMIGAAYLARPEK